MPIAHRQRQEKGESTAFLSENIQNWTIPSTGSSLSSFQSSSRSKSKCQVTFVSGLSLRAPSFDPWVTTTAHYVPLLALRLVSPDICLGSLLAPSPSAGNPWPWDRSRLLTQLIALVFSLNPFNRSENGHVPWGPHIFSKWYVGGREGVENDVPFSPKDFRDSYLQFLETMISMFQRQSPSQPVDLKFCYT